MPPNTCPAYGCDETLSFADKLGISSGGGLNAVTGLNWLVVISLVIAIALLVVIIMRHIRNKAHPDKGIPLKALTIAIFVVILIIIAVTIILHFMFGGGFERTYYGII